MNSRQPISAQIFFLAAFCVSAACGSLRAAVTVDEPATKSPAWQTPSRETLTGEVETWLQFVAGDNRDAADRLLSQAAPHLVRLKNLDDRLDALVAALAVGSPRIAELVADCRQSTPPVEAIEWLDSDDFSAFVKSNVRLFVGRALVRSGYYEPALDFMDQVSLEHAADPTSLLFYRAVAEHQLVRVEAAKTTLTTLLGADQTLPPRFEQLARLMQSDIARVEDDSLDHIARRMSDVRRRLALGDAGERSQTVEREILEALDKAIEEAEEQQRQQQQQQQQAGGQPSGTPMEDSQIAELKGEGKVDPKEIGNQDGWGDLPPRERERVMQQIGRDFPAHYSDLIEQYLRRLATEEREEANP